MYCTTCGKELPDGTPVCDECGTVFSSDGHSASSRDETESGGRRDEPENPEPVSETESGHRPYMDYKLNSCWREPYRQEEPVAPDRTGFAIASLVLGIIALCSCCLPVITVPLGILTVVFAALGLKSGNRGIAIAGLVLGIVSLVLGTMMLILFLLSGGRSFSHIW